MLERVLAVGTVVGCVGADINCGYGDGCVGEGINCGYGNGVCWRVYKFCVR